MNVVIQMIASYYEEKAVAAAQQANETGFPVSITNPEGEIMKVLPEDKSCVECGSSEKTTFEEDPFASEMYGDTTPRWMCEDCLIQSAMDV